MRKRKRKEKKKKKKRKKKRERKRERETIHHAEVLDYIIQDRRRDPGVLPLKTLWQNPAHSKIGLE